MYLKMGRSPCCSKEGLNRGAWTAIEDKILSGYIKTHGEGRWRNLPKEAGLKRCGKSCRLRWLNYLRPNIKRGNISEDEEELIIRLHRLLGNRWSLIAGRLPGRTDNEIKNYWNTNLGKKAKREKQSTPSKTEMKATTKKFDPPESSVIRSKAMRCTSKVIRTIRDQNLNNEASVKPFTNEKTVKIPEGDKLGDRSSALTAEEDRYSSNFMVDFNMGDIGFSEMLGPNFNVMDYNEFDIFHLEHVMDGDDNITNNNDEDDNCGLEEMMDKRGECFAKCDMDSDLQSLACFLESSEEWISSDLNVQ